MGVREAIEIPVCLILESVPGCGMIKRKREEKLKRDERENST